MSTSTGAPAARARSEGVKVLMKGTATVTPPAAPAQPAMAIQVRLLLSMSLPVLLLSAGFALPATAWLGVPLMLFLWRLWSAGRCSGTTRDSSRAPCAHLTWH
jgi:hypothetical protein